jgi:hypothetical protein
VIDERTLNIQAKLVAISAVQSFIACLKVSIIPLSDTVQQYVVPIGR